MADISKITLLNGITYDLKDQFARNGLYYGVSETGAGIATKTVTIDGVTELTAGLVIAVKFANTNTAEDALTLNINNTGAIQIYINGMPSSSSNYTLPSGKYIVYYDGTAYQIRTDGLIPIDISGNAATVNNHTVNSDVPINAVFTDTTYDLATASSAGLLSASDKNKLDSIIVSNANSPILAVETSSFSSLPMTITSDKITVNHYLLESTLSNPSAQTSDWTVTTANGSMTIAGSINGSTTALIMLGRVDSESATMLVFDIASFSSLPQTITDSRITPYHYILHTEVGTPTAQTGDWTITTGTGTMTIDGDISGSTTLRVILGTAGSL